LGGGRQQRGVVEQPRRRVSHTAAVQAHVVKLDLHASVDEQADLLPHERPQLVEAGIAGRRVQPR
jgi:hypothetical protein